MSKFILIALYLVLAALLVTLCANFILMYQFAEPVPYFGGALPWPSQATGLVLGATALVVLLLIGMVHVRSRRRVTADQPYSHRIVKAGNKPAWGAGPDPDVGRLRERSADIGQAAALLAAQIQELRAVTLQLSESQTHQAREIRALNGALARAADADKLAQRVKSLETSAGQTAEDAKQVVQSIADMAKKVHQVRDWAADLNQT